MSSRETGVQPERRHSRIGCHNHAAPARRDGAELLAHVLANQLQRLEAGWRSRRMDADPFEGAMIDADEDGHGTFLQRHGAGRIGPPHLIRACRRGPVAPRRAVPDWAPKDRPATSAAAHDVWMYKPLEPQAHPHFTMLFAKKGRRL
jgi:hypothetical protein